MKELKIMKNIDSFLFKQIDNLNNNAEYQKVSDAYSALDEKAQEGIKIFLMILCIGLPLLLIIIFYNINSSKKADLKIKDELITTANNLIQKKSLLKGEERKILSSKYVGSQSALKNTITSSLSLVSIDSSKIKISAFDSSDLDGLITKLKADLTFKGLTSGEMMALFNSLSAKLKIKFEEISIKKNESTNSLDGVITLHYYSKDTSSNE